MICEHANCTQSVSCPDGVQPVEIEGQCCRRCPGNLVDIVGEFRVCVWRQSLSCPCVVQPVEIKGQCCKRCPDNLVDIFG